MKQTIINNIDMKRVLIALALMLAIPTVVLAQDKEKKDTTINMKNGGIILNDDGIYVIPPDTGKDSMRSIELRLGSNGGLQYFDGTKPPKDSQTLMTTWFTMDLGVNNLMNTDGKFEMPKGYENLELNTGKSLEFNLGIIQQGLNLYRYKLRFVYGAGFHYNNYRFNNDVLLTKNTNPLMTTLDSGANYRKNKLVAKYLSVPLYFSYKSKPFKPGKSFTFAFGGEFNYLMNSWQKTKDNSSKNKTYDDFSLATTRVNAVARLGYAGLDFYVRYGLSDLFKDNAGPKVTPMSFGIALSSY